MRIRYTVGMGKKRDMGEGLPGAELGRASVQVPRSRARKRQDKAREEIRDALAGLASTPSAEAVVLTATGVPASQASRAVGLVSPPKGISAAAYRDAVQAERARVAQTIGLGWESSVNYYKDIADNCKIDDPGTGIRARRRIDAILGYDAPTEAIIGDANNVAGDSAAELLTYLRQAGVSPHRMLKDITDICQIATNTQQNADNPQ